METLCTSFRCELCSELLYEPIVLPCGETICRRHSDQIFKAASCQFCAKPHARPENGEFPLNEIVQRYLQIQLKSININLIEYNRNRKSVRNLGATIQQIETMYKDPICYLSDYFGKLKSELDVKRDGSIRILEQANTDCIKWASSQAGRHVASKFDFDLINLKAELNKLQEKVFGSGDDAMVKKSRELEERLDSIVETYRSAILKNKVVTIETDLVRIAHNISTQTNLPEVRFDLEVTSEKPFPDSKILSDRACNDLTHLCQFSPDQKWNLVYRATEHGFGFEDFHKKCPRQKNCLTIVKSENGNIFGGYTNATWNKRPRWIKDEHAFIFSLINQENTSFKIKCSEPKYAVFGQYKNSLMGWGYDELDIEADSNVLASCCSNLGEYYRHDDYKRNSDKAKEILAGTHDFKTLEIEMYCKMR